MKKTVLLVDDEEEVLHALLRLFRNEGYRLLTASSGAEALRLLAGDEAQVVISDQRMAGMSGVELLARIHQLDPECIGIILSGYADLAVVTAAVNVGHVDKFLFKPWDDELLLACVREAFDSVAVPPGRCFPALFPDQDAGRLTRKLLIVDNDVQVVSALTHLLGGQGYYLLTAGSAEAALHQFENHRVGVILCNQRLPGMTGTALMQRVRELHPTTVRLLMSGYADIQSVTAAINEGHVYKFLFKPWDNQQLLANIGEAFEKFDLAERGAQFYRIYESTPEAIAIADREHLIQVINPAFSSISGYAAEDAVGQPIALLFAENRDGTHSPPPWMRQPHREKWAGEISCRRKNGEVYPAWFNVTVMFDGQQQVSHSIVMFSDITEHKCVAAPGTAEGNLGEPIF